MKCFVGKSMPILLEYVVDGEFVIPSAAWATLYGNDGAELLSAPLAPASTQETFEIGAQYATILDGLDFENRFLWVTFTSGGSSHDLNISYQVVPFLPMTATAATVRASLGLDMLELPDDAVDVYDAYLQLRSEYGASITTALTSGTAQAFAANRAISIKAALLIVNSIEFRAAVEVKAEDSSFKRQGDFSVDALRIRLGNQLGRELDIILGETTDSQTSFILTNPTDVITGE